MLSNTTVRIDSTCSPCGPEKRIICSRLIKIAACDRCVVWLNNFKFHGTQEFGVWMRLVIRNSQRLDGSAFSRELLILRPSAPLVVRTLSMLTYPAVDLQATHTFHPFASIGSLKNTSHENSVPNKLGVFISCSNRQGRLCMLQGAHFSQIGLQRPRNEAPPKMSQCSCCGEGTHPSPSFLRTFHLDKQAVDQRRERDQQQHAALSLTLGGPEYLGSGTLVTIQRSGLAVSCRSP